MSESGVSEKWWWWIVGIAAWAEGEELWEREA